MAKSVIEAVTRRAAQVSQQASTRPSTVGRSVLGFKKDYSEADLKRIDSERRDMRARLSSDR